MWILPNNLKTSSAFVADTLESSEDLSLPGLNLEHSLMWRSKPSPLQTWSRRWKRVPWIRALSGRILKPSQHISFETELTSSRAAILASRSQPQESAPERMIPGTSGPGSENISRQCDLFDASSKTSKDTSASDSEKLLKTWKNLVLKRRGDFSARLKSARLINESESTSWLTPLVQDSKHSGTNPGPNGKRERLVNQVNWPTPTATDNGQRPRTRQEQPTRHSAGQRSSDSSSVESKRMVADSDSTRLRQSDQKDARQSSEQSDSIGLSSRDLPDPSSGRRGEIPAIRGQSSIEVSGSESSARRPRTIPDANSQGLEGRLHRGIVDSERRQESEIRRATECSDWGSWDGRQVWSPEPGLGRVVDGCPDRVDRLRLLGNGVVPSTAAQAWTVLGKQLWQT